jgi:TonB family protein
MTPEPLPLSIEPSPDRISWARDLEQRSFQRWVLYGTALSAGLHIALGGIGVNPPTDVISQRESHQSIDFVVIETPPEAEIESAAVSKPVNSPVPPASETVYVPRSTPQSTSRTVTRPAPVPNRELRRASADPHSPTRTMPQSPPRETVENRTESAGTTPTSHPSAPAPVDNFPEAIPSPNPSVPAPADNFPESTAPAEAVPNPNSSPIATGENAENSSGNLLPDSIHSLLRGITGETPAPSTGTAPTRERIRCLRCDKPEYPPEARRRNLQGEAKVSVDVDSNGNVINVRLVQSSGHPELDQAALQQARRWQFSSSTTGKQGINGRVDFQLEGSEYQRQRRQEVSRETPRENISESVPTPKIEPITAPRETATQPKLPSAPTASESMPTPQAEPITAPRETATQPKFPSPPTVGEPPQMEPVPPPPTPVELPVEPAIPSENP